MTARASDRSVTLRRQLAFSLSSAVSEKRERDARPVAHQMEARLVGRVQRFAERIGAHEWLPVAKGSER